ncbi:MAG: endonuclease/exonuclease/phosphatase family protein [Gammaproteobacteria bacterium]
MFSRPASAEQEKMRFLSFNLPCFPSVFGHRFNSKILTKLNLERAKIFVEKIKSTHPQYDVIGLQEIWDPSVANYLEKELGDIFEFRIRGTRGDICCPPPRRVSSGLMLFSRREIVDVKIGSFNNSTAGEETFGEKGYIAAKLAGEKNQFDTVILTHLHADGDFYSNLSVLLGGTADHRRGEQMKMINEETHAWAKQSPQGMNLTSRHTILMGDINTPIDCKYDGEMVNDEKWLGLEVGQQRIQLKKFGQFELLKHYAPKNPKNYIETNEEKVTSTSKVSSFNGSLNYLCNPKVPHELIDIIAQRKDGAAMGDLQTEIVSFDTDKVAVSDHFAIAGILDFSKPFRQPPSKFSSCTPKKISEYNSSAGFWNRAGLYEISMPKKIELSDERKSEIRLTTL